MKKILLVISIIFLLFQISHSTVLDPKDFEPNPILTLETSPVDAKIQVDGVLEPSWENAIRFENFAEFMPEHQVQAKVPTEGYITHDESSLYVAFVCYDPDVNDLRASVTDRDNIFEDDFVGIVIDTYQDRQRAYEFFSNPHGIQGDMLWQANRTDNDDEGAIWQANGGEDESFDAVWESEGRIFDDKWIVEMKIPFTNLRYPNTNLQNWSVHFVRTYPRNNRYQFSWMPISQDNNSFMDQAGNLVLNIDLDSSSNRSLEIMPYVVGSQAGSLIQNENEEGTWDRSDPDSRFGFSSKYTITSNNILDFTYKPDFSQIEADEGRITANNPFALFYAERRPFFVEGSDIFQIDRGTRGLALDQQANLIYTRSINDPLVAGKLTGKSGKVTYGFISAYDDNTPFALPFADRSAVLNTDENSWTNILRAKYDVGKQSYIGFAATNRTLEMDGSNSTASVDANIRLSEKYTLTALTAMTYTDEPVHQSLSENIAGWMGENYEFEQGGNSYTAAFDGENFFGHIFKTRFLRQARHWNASLGYQDFSPGVRTDNGSIFSNDGRTFDAWTGYTFRYDESKLFSAVTPQVGVWRKYDYDGDVKDTGIRPQINIQFQRQTSMTVSAFLFNREKYGGIKFGDARNFWVFLGTNMFQKVSGSAFFLFGESINRRGEYGDPHNPFEIVPEIDFNANLTLHPTDKLESDFQYRSTRLWTNDRDLIVKQQILRNTLAYQFSKKLFVRLIGEMIFYDHHYPERDNQFFSIEPLLGFKMNPFTLFYLGANIGGEDDPYLNYDGLTPTDQTVFVKFQYLWQVL